MPKQTPLEHSYAQNTPMDAEVSLARRRSASRERANRFVTYLVIGSLAVVGGAEAVYKLTQPKSHTVTELVRAGDNPTTVAQRAEHQYGSDPQDYDVQSAAMAIADRYGDLQPGEIVEVTVK